MNVHQVTLTIIDHDKLGAEGVISALENAHYPNRCISPHVRGVVTKDIGPWSDDHPLNGLATQADELLRLFGPVQLSDAGK